MGRNISSIIEKSPPEGFRFCNRIYQVGDAVLCEGQMYRVWRTEERWPNGRFDSNGLYVYLVPYHRADLLMSEIIPFRVRADVLDRHQKPWTLKPVKDWRVSPVEIGRPVGL